MSDLPGTPPLLKVDDLSVTFGQPEEKTVVDGIHFQLRSGRCLAIVGESGSGKSVTALALTRLIGKRQSAKISGHIQFAGTEISRLGESALRRIRGNRIAYIFQDPGHSLHPAIPVGRQVAECLRQAGSGQRVTSARVFDLLARVHLTRPEEVARQYPAELSGGMQQRVVIAMALALKPDLLVSDEATTALDATTQFRILQLMKDIQQAEGMALLFITHNFGLLPFMSDEVMVLRRGKRVESGPTGEVLQDPASAYTRHLIDCVPKLGQARSRFPAPLSG